MGLTTRVLRRVGMVLVLVGACSAAASAQDAQGAPPPPPRRPPAATGGQLDAPPTNPAEVGKLFDAYAVLRAQEQLGLTEEQFGRFVSRFTTLLDARRRQAQTRLRLLNQLGRLLRDGASDEATLRDHLRTLDDHDASSVIEVRTASDAVSALLTPMQQARFRLFEAQLERRKLDLMTRARQGNRRNQRLP